MLPIRLAVSVSDLLNNHPQHCSLAVATARDFIQLNCFENCLENSGMFFNHESTFSGKL